MLSDISNCSLDHKEQKISTGLALTRYPDIGQRSTNFLKPLYRDKNVKNSLVYTHSTLFGHFDAFTAIEGGKAPSLFIPASGFLQTT